MPFQHYSPKNNKTNENGYTWYECNCCPYGYHIDLDFVRYCESISQEADNRTGSIKKRKDRRRQRQSMEVLLGLTPHVVAALEQHYSPVQEKNSPHLPTEETTKFPLITDGFDHAVTYFERTLQRSENKLSNNLPDVTAVTASCPNMAVLPTVPDGPSRNDIDVVESFGMSPGALHNIREQMALSLERTKELEDQVKLVPELKEQLSLLREENRKLILHLKSKEAEKLHTSNANYVQTQSGHQRSRSYNTDIDSLGSNLKKESPPTLRKDFGVMCGVLTRNVGVGHQNPCTKSVSTATFDNEIGDKWLSEKVKYLNNQIIANYSNNRSTISIETQTPCSKEKKHVEIPKMNGYTQTNEMQIPKVSDYTQTSEVLQISKLDGCTQTVEMLRRFNNVGILAKTVSSNVAIQKYVECYSVGCSDDSTCDVICEKCNAFKRTVAVGPDTNEDTHTSSISLASLTSRSKSFNFGDDKRSLSTRTRTTSSQYEPNNITRACQSDIRVQSSTKSCQCDQQTSDKNTQYENNSISKSTYTVDCSLPKKHVACEAKEVIDTRDVGCNIAAEIGCAKCNKEKDDALKRDGGSPTPSRIPRLQIPTTPVENRKFRRQDTRILSSPTDKSITTSPTIRLSGLDVSPRAILNEPNAIEKVKHNFKLEDSHSTAQNGSNTAPITKVQIQEITLPVSESTIFPSAAQGQTRKKAGPSKEMQGALKVLNDSLQKTPSRNLKNHSATSIVQQEWFNSSSMVTANPLDVEDYLDTFEEMSNLLLQYVVNMSDASGNTAMHYAVSHGNFDVVSILLDSKVCDINKQNKAGYTSVMLVSLAEVRSQTHANVVRRLFQLADVNIRAKQHGQTALMLAVSHGRLDMVKMLLEAGADINIQDEDGSTALMCAAEHGHIDIVKHFLCQPDCDSSITDVDGSTALKIAMEAGHRHIGVLLYAHERNMQKTHTTRLTKSKSVSPKLPSSPLPIRSSLRALTETKTK